ncbi:hypothetical protein JVT61DRAFT_8468 [Boletus reticuloceps]|uniref:Transmembrane protein n=1 Tax=Boletus reticuloceps TaxID=495285 RepID=A0A8I3ACH4_9AGAM|nr:hypothetical protein JVT61DRAFT_8468 [Boletus reticuloceps]
MTLVYPLTILFFSTQTTTTSRWVETACSSRRNRSLLPRRTKSDIIDYRIEEEILFCAMKLIERALRTNGVTLDDLTEIVLNVDDGRCWHYYFVDHTNRFLFWVDTVSLKDLNIGLQGGIWSRHITGMLLLHIVYDMELRSHCEYYPHNRILFKRAFGELRGMLNYTKTDMMTTDSSSSPFGQDEVVAILDLVNSFKDNEKISDPYSIWVIARFMEYLTENQFLKICGQPCARLNADTPLLEQENWNRRILFQVVNVFLFGSPNEHAVRLQSVWVDGIIIQPRWKDFINRLTSDSVRVGPVHHFCETFPVALPDTNANADIYGSQSTVMLAVNLNCSLVSTIDRVLLWLVEHVQQPRTDGRSECSTSPAKLYDPLEMFTTWLGPWFWYEHRQLEAMWTLSQTKTRMACLAITHTLLVIVLFSAALAVQIFGRKELAIVATLSVEFLIIVSFVVMGVRVMRLFYSNGGEDNVDTPTERNLFPLDGRGCNVPRPMCAEHEVANRNIEESMLMAESRSKAMKSESRNKYKDGMGVAHPPRLTITHAR